MDDTNTPEYRYTNCRPITAEEAETRLRAAVRYLAIAEKASICCNVQSCDCDEVVFCVEDGLLLAKHAAVPYMNEYEETERIYFFRIDCFQEDYFNWKVDPSGGGAIQFVKAHYDEKGVMEEAKFLYGPYFLYLFAMEATLVVTKSRNELFIDKENGGQFCEEDDSILFDFLV